MDYRLFLIRLANQLDEEGNHHLADIIDKDFEEFLKLLEDGKLEFNYTFYGKRDPRKPYTNYGREVPISAV